MENQLPHTVIAQLYKNNLVLAEEQISEAEGKNPPREGKKNNESQSKLSEILWLGKNKKHVAILLHDENNKFISEDNLNFLLSILNACRLTPDDIAVVNIAKTPVDYSQLKETLSPSAILLFDVQPEAIAIKAKPVYYTTFTHDNCKLLSAVSLDKLNGNTPEKKLEKGKLWNGLKKLLGL